MEIPLNTDVAVMVIWGLIFAIFVIKLFQSIRLVPTKSAYIVERLGKYHSTLDAGFHTLIPFVDKVAYIRFASVYRDFREAKDFETFVGGLSEAVNGVKGKPD